MPAQVVAAEVEAPDTSLSPRLPIRPGTSASPEAAAVAAVAAEEVEVAAEAAA